VKLALLQRLDTSSDTVGSNKRRVEFLVDIRSLILVAPLESVGENGDIEKKRHQDQVKNLQLV
jgi:hypothetical protein